VVTFSAEGRAWIETGGKILKRSRYEKEDLQVSGYCDGGFGKPHGAWMSLVAASGTSRVAGTSADSGSRQVEAEGSPSP